MKRSLFFRVRVALLLTVLAGVILYAWLDRRRRAERLEWNRTLDVALVLVTDGTVDPNDVDALRSRAPALSARLADEMHRYRSGAPSPFAVTVFGPVLALGKPPTLEDDGVIALAKQSYSMWRYYGDVDERAQVSSSAFDARVYLVVRTPKNVKRAFVEGSSEQGGRIGCVEVELGPGTVDFALIVAAHELGHTLGATDKYDAQGHTIIPDGLAEPDLVPQVPQRYVDVMARMIPGVGREDPPNTIDDLAVGPVTAREIGWR